MTVRTTGFTQGAIPVITFIPIVMVYRRGQGLSLPTAPMAPNDGHV